MMLRSLSRIATLCVVLFLAAPASAWDREDFRAQAEDLLGQDTASTNKFFTELSINWHINAGIYFLSRVTQAVVAETTIVLSVGVTEYGLPVDAIDITSVVLSYNGPSIPLQRSPQGLMRRSGAEMGTDPQPKESGPIAFQFRGENLKAMRLTPMPVSADTAIVTYAHYADTLGSASDTTDLPPGFQPLIPMYAAWKAYTKTRLPNTYREEFIAELQAIMGRESQSDPPLENPRAP